MKVGEREYKLKNQTATLMVRPRGWHLDEAHVLVHGKPGMPVNFSMHRLAKKLTPSPMCRVRSQCRVRCSTLVSTSSTTAARC